MPLERDSQLQPEFSAADLAALAFLSFFYPLAAVVRACYHSFACRMRTTCRLGTQSKILYPFLCTLITARILHISLFFFPPSWKDQFYYSHDTSTVLCFGLRVLSMVKWKYVTLGKTDLADNKKITLSVSLS